VFHVTYDRRERGTVFVANNSPVWGPEILKSHDLGDTWVNSTEGPRFESKGGATVKRVWHIEPGDPWEPGVVYAGAEPASLFRSEDWGATWNNNTAPRNGRRRCLDRK
jgi:hypothetical protein